MNTPTEKCSHPDCGFFKDGAGTGCRAMRDNACASERATEAGTPATAVELPAPMYLDVNAGGHPVDGYDERMMREYGAARAEEARREVVRQISDAIVDARVKRGEFAGFPVTSVEEIAQLAAAQRPAGGDAVKVPDEWVSEVCGPEVDDLTYGQGYRRGFNDCRSAVLELSAAQPVEEAAAQADAWITPQVAQNLDRQYRDGFMAGWNAQLDGDEELLAAVQSRVKPLAEYAAAPTAQPTPPLGSEQAAVTPAPAQPTPPGALQQMANAGFDVAYGGAKVAAQPTPPDDERAVAALVKDAIQEVNEGADTFMASLIAARKIAALRHPPVPNVGDWLPTAENLNALPVPIREYVHDLETRCDPAGLVRDNALTKDHVRMVTADNKRLREALAEMDGSFEAAYVEGLSDVLAATTDEALKDLVERRLIMGREAITAVLGHAASQPTQAGAEPAAAATIDTPRWTFTMGIARQHPEGEWVEHTDHVAAIAAAREEARKASEAEIASLTDDIVELSKVREENRDLRARLASAGAGEKGEHPLEIYADSYDSMARQGCTSVHPTCVATDIRQNMIPVTCAARQDSAAADKGGA